MTVSPVAAPSRSIIRFGLGLALATLVVDQLNKWWMLQVYRIAEKGTAGVDVLPFLKFVFVKNVGVSYGLGAGMFSPMSLAVFSFVAAAALLVWLVRSSDSRLMAGSIGLIAGGAVGNGIDRLHLGGVADFYQLHGFGYSWYVFNIADVAIVAGVIGLLYESFWASRKGASNVP